MSSPPITCHVNDTLDAVAKHMWDGDVGALPVVNDEGKLTGMITDRDVCMTAFTQGRPLVDLLVNIAMAQHVISVGPEASLDEIERLMAKHQIRRLPVVDESGAPIGLVSLNDIALAAASHVAGPLAAICRHRTEVERAA